MNVPLTPIRFLRYAGEQFADDPAIVCGDHRFTYAQFADRAARLAGALRAEGARPGDRVAFLSTNCHRLLEAYYGVLEAECVLLPLNVRLAPAELSYVLNDAGARFLFVEPMLLPLAEAFRRDVPGIERFIVFDGVPQAGWLLPRTYDDLVAASAPFHRELMEVDENAVAELFYTSGTSDAPRGVMLTHRNIYLHALLVIASGRTSRDVVGNTCCDTVSLHTIPLFHANGWGSAHTVTLVGGKHVMVHQFIPAEVLRLIEQEKVTNCALVPTMATALVNCVEREKYDLGSLRCVMIGGAASAPTLVREVEEKLGGACISGYGLTETSPVLTVSSLKKGVPCNDESRPHKRARAGYAIPGVEVRVVDADGKDVPRDGETIGEVVARGDVIMEGYWKRPKDTQTAMAGGWFHTGDLATMDDDHYVLIVDRKKDIIVSGGENISSLEVEKVLVAHPAVYEAVVIPVPHEKWGEVPKALIVRKPGADVSEPDLVAFCRARLAHYKCPQSVEFLDSFPKTGTGKILKRELRKVYGSPVASAPTSGDCRTAL
ncbi:MAG TPA: long-chain-fatty-acid--CoA ligase [Vicinamibacterales bacterium]|nr:long-chain-fatty-acid--CoA ligase [Vicinamibacterales bacterium]